VARRPSLQPADVFAVVAVTVALGRTVICLAWRHHGLSTTAAVVVITTHVVGRRDDRLRGGLALLVG